MVSKEDKMYELKFEVAKLFDSKCYVCEKTYRGKRGFLYHHLSYIFGEKIYRDFKSTVDYNLYILPIVKKDPNRFLLLCGPCHTTLEKLKRRKKENLLRLLNALWRTK